MASKPTLNDFKEVLRRRAAEGVRELGKASAAIQAQAARSGGLTNNRIVFLYTDALIQHWNELASEVMDDLRRWSRTTRIGRGPLREAAEAILRSVIPQLITASRAERSREQFANQAMLASAVERVEGISQDLDFRLRQFDISMDDPNAPPQMSWPRKCWNWTRDHVSEVIVGIILIVIAALLGLS